jgi:hypothetical protein
VSVHSKIPSPNAVLEKMNANIIITLSISRENAPVFGAIFPRTSVPSPDIEAVQAETPQE